MIFKKRRTAAFFEIYFAVSPNVLGSAPQKNVLCFPDLRAPDFSSKRMRTFFCGARERSERRGGSIIVRMFVEVGSDFNQKVPHFIQIPILGGGFEPVKFI